MPTSKEINQAIELLRQAEISEQIITDLDVWNYQRLKAAARHVTNRDAMLELFDGIAPENLADAGIVV